MFARKLAWASDEDVQDNCKDAPQAGLAARHSGRTHPVIIGTAPLHANDGDSCTRGGRFGAHNLHPNFPGPLYARLENTTVASWFNGGVRIFRAVEGAERRTWRATARRGDRLLTSRRRRRRIRAGTIQINHAIVDEKRGLDLRQRSLHRADSIILRYTGAVPPRLESRSSFGSDNGFRKGATEKRSVTPIAPT